MTVTRAKTFSNQFATTSVRRRSSISARSWSFTGPGPKHLRNRGRGRNRRENRLVHSNAASRIGFDGLSPPPVLQHDDETEYALDQIEHARHAVPGREAIAKNALHHFRG